MRKEKVCLLLTGSELMNGDVIDTNSIMVAKALNELNLPISKKVTIGDELQTLSQEIITLSLQFEFLLINGGLGPTTDDLTAQALALSANIDLELNQTAHQHVTNWANKREQPLNDSNLKQAYLPENCHIIQNEIGSAVGFSLRLNNCLIVCTPGVPRELNEMLNKYIVPILNRTFPTRNKQEIIRIQTFGLGESRIQELIHANFPNWPETLSIGFRATMPILEVKLICNEPNGSELTALWLKKVKAILGDHVIAVDHFDTDILAKNVISYLAKDNLTITTAESCTGGLIASQITKIDGASRVFEGGFVTYSNMMKHKMLGVDDAIIDAHGAVSKQTVIAMAQGALQQANADVAIAVSGIAGPNGGTRDKPVGSVWIAWGTKTKIHAEYFLIKGERKFVQQITAARSLDLVRRMLIKSNELPQYRANN